MKDHLKKLLLKAMRPGLSEVHARLDAVQDHLPAADAKLEATLAGLRNLYQQAQGTQDAVAAIHAAIPALFDRLSKIERRLTTTAIWRGGLSGHAVDFAGNPIPEMTAKYYAELAFWEAMVRRESIPTWGRPFAEVFGIWQRMRMTELAEFLDLGQGDAAFDALSVWSCGRTAIEIGSGPFPSISLTPWKQGIAIDPLAEGYLAEDLIPKVAHAPQIAFIAAVGESIPVPAKSADLIVLENCLDHVEDPALVLRESRRLLRDDGLLWLLVDLMDYKDHMHPHPFSEKSIKGMLLAEGFEIVRDRTSSHKSHPQAYGEYRALLKKGTLHAGSPMQSANSVADRDAQAANPAPISTPTHA